MSQEIQKIPLPADFQHRVETGTVQFGDDWPGVFIRGDSAAWYAMCLEQIVKKYGEQLQPITELAPLRNLVSILQNSNQNNENI